MEKSIFTKPKLCKAKQGWYAYFRFNKQLFRYKYELNRIQDLKEREREFNLLCAALHQKLNEGWNPLVPVIKINSVQLTFTEALDFALEKKKSNISKKTFSDYTCTVRFTKQAIKELSLRYLLMKDVKRLHIKLIIDKMKELRSWSNKAHNKHLNHLKAILSELIQWDIIEVSPAHSIKNLPVEETEGFKPPTIEQHQKIKEYLQEKHPDFLNFISVVYHTGIRPNEIIQIKLDMIDLKNQEIILPAEITKTNKTRIVPVNQFLLETLTEMKIHNYPKNYFLFGSFRQAGKGNVGGKKDFIIGPTKLKRDTATKRWKKIVKDELGFDVDMYGYKRFGGDRKILAGLDLDSLRELYGHSSKFMTIKYAKVVKEVHRKNIMEKSPDF